MSTIEERVARGVTWLDEKLPGWWETHRFDLEMFDLRSGCNCVIGQLYPLTTGTNPDWDDSAFDQAMSAAWLDLTWVMAEAIGFYAGSPFDGQHDAEYTALDAEWRRVITERRAAACTT